eukprot:755656-Hanusia_phi.AAC.12
MENPIILAVIRRCRAALLAQSEPPGGPGRAWTCLEIFINNVLRQTSKIARDRESEAGDARREVGWR